MDWSPNAHDWPMAEYSEFVLCKPHRWHVQTAGSGPLLLLIHGAGGATQSWRHLFPLLTKHFRVVAIDLPGQGFTKLGAQQRCGLPAMAQDIVSLMRAQGWEPAAIIGHSAGAAIALEMTSDIVGQQPKIIGINAAFDSFKGVAGLVFPVMAKTLAMLPMVADLFVASAGRGQGVQKLIDGTGSALSPHDLIFYKRLLNDRQHVNATLHMMAQWDLEPLIARLPKITNEILLLVGTADAMVPPQVSKSAAQVMPNARFHALGGLGHLAHEEAPDIVAQQIFAFLGITT